MAAKTFLNKPLTKNRRAVQYTHGAEKMTKKQQTTNTDQQPPEKPIFYFIHTDPVPKERARFGRYSTYTPDKTAAETLVQLLRSREHAPRGGPYRGGVQVILNYYMSPKKSKNKKATTDDPHTTTPDGDNLGKLTLDALTKALKFWHDDGQANSLLFNKQYSDTPGVGICICYNNLTRPDRDCYKLILEAGLNRETTQPEHIRKRGL